MTHLSVPTNFDLSEKWDQRPWTHHVSETRNPRPETLNLEAETLGARPNTQFIDGTRDPRPGTLKVGPETRHLGHLFYTGRKTQDPSHSKSDLGQL